MLPNEFTDDYLSPLIEKISLAKKQAIILGDFNMDLMKFDQNNDISNFLQTITSNSLFPFITLPTRITTHSKTLIDNIFHNFYTPDIISGNLTISISDHLAQFVLIPSLPEQKKVNKYYKRSFAKFNKERFINDIANVPWDTHIKENDDVNNSIKTTLNIFERVLNKHAPYKQVSKKDLIKLKKPWISKGISKSIATKNKLHKKYLKAKDQKMKDFLFEKFKRHRNTISNLTKISKKKLLHRIL